MVCVGEGVINRKLPMTSVEVVYWHYAPCNCGSYDIYYSIRTAVFYSSFSKAAGLFYFFSLRLPRVFGLFLSLFYSTTKKEGT